MNKRNLLRIIAAIFIVSLLTPTLIVGADYLTQFAHYDNYDGGTSSQVFLTNQRGQTFTAPANHQIYTIKLRMCYTGTANGSVHIDFYATDANSKPTGNSIAWGDIEASELNYYADGYAEETISLGFYNTTEFIKDEKYAFVITYPGGANAFNCVRIDGQHFNPNYEEGTHIASWDSGTSWTLLPDVDSYFNLLGLYTGYGWGDVSIQTLNGYTSQSSAGNSTIAFWADVYPSYVTQNVTARLSANSDFSSPITLYSFGGQDIGGNTWRQYFTDLEPGASGYGNLLPSTTYYYQAIASINGTLKYGNILWITTDNITPPDQPAISMISIKDISDQYDENYVFELTGKYTEITDNGTVTSDPVVSKGFLISGYATNDGQLLPDILQVYPFEDYPDGTFKRIVVLDNTDWYSGGKFYTKAYINTPYHGDILSKLVIFNPEQNDIIVDPGGDSNIDSIINVINTSLNRHGFGNKVGKFIIIFILMVIAYVYTPDRKMKRIFSLAILGIGILSGWIPIWLTVLLATAAAIFGYQWFRNKTQGAS